MQIRVWRFQPEAGAEDIEVNEDDSITELFTRRFENIKRLFGEGNCSYRL